MPFKIKYKPITSYTYSEIVRYILKPFFKLKKYEPFYQKICSFIDDISENTNVELLIESNNDEYILFLKKFNKYFKNISPKIINDIRSKLLYKMINSVYYNNIIYDHVRYFSKNGIFLYSDLKSLLRRNPYTLNTNEDSYYLSFLRIFQKIYVNNKIIKKNNDMIYFYLIDCFINNFFTSNYTFYSLKYCPLFILYDLDNSVLYCNKKEIVAQMIDNNIDCNNFENFKIECNYYCNCYPIELFRIDNKKVIIKK